MKRHSVSRPIAALFIAVLVVAAAPSLARSLAAAGLAERSEPLQFSSGGHVLGFEPGAMLAATGSHALRVEFVGANALTPQSGAAGGRALAPLTSVTYPGLWDGVTLTYDAGGIVRSTYRLEPYADVVAIRLRYNRPVQLQADGSLRIAFEAGAMRETAPIAWQELEGRRIPVEVAFAVQSATEVGFATGRYDPARPLFIDPTLTWHTFIGSGGTDQAFGIAVDGLGNVYVTGVSPAWGTPVNPHAGGTDAFVAKLDNAGARLWHTFLGGGSADQGRAIAVDAGGSIYVAGTSGATWGTPVNPFAGGQDAFVARLDSSGVRQWHAFLGGSGTDQGFGVAVDAGGSVYVAGTSSATWGAPVNPYAGSNDAFAARMDSAGARLWHTFLGSAGVDNGMSIAVDANGAVYVAGDSTAAWGAPVSPHAGSSDAFAARLDSAGARQWHTFLGGSNFDQGFGVAVDGSGAVYVVGTSAASWGAPINPFAGGGDAFAARLDSAGVRQWHTYLGSGAADQGFGIAVDASGNVYVAGDSAASWGAPINPFAGGRDAFAAALNSAGVRQWHSFLGSTIFDQGRAVAVVGPGVVYVVGESTATWGAPVNPLTGSTDAFVARIGDVLPVTPTPTETLTPTDTPTSTPTDTPAPTDTPTSTPTDTPAPTDTPTSTPTSTPTLTSSATSTPTKMPTSTPAVWSADTSGTTSSLASVDCPTTKLCKAVAKDGTIRSWNGRAWSGETSGTTYLILDVDCPTTKLCKAVGLNGTIRSWNGRAWSGDTSGTTSSLVSVDCPTTKLCKAVVSNGTIRSWDGTTWSADTSGTTNFLTSVACPTTTLCKAVGGSGTILSWDGTTWSADTSGTTSTLVGVDCASTTLCKAVGFNGTIRSWNSTTWSADTSGTTQGLSGVACPTTMLCKAVGANGTIRSWNGASWSTDTSGTTQGLSDVACLTTTFCKAVGGSGTIRSLLSQN